MSTSTIFIKKPVNYRQSLIRLREKYQRYSPLLSLLLWSFSGLYAAAKGNFTQNLNGMTISFAIYDLLLMFVASVLLYQGLAWKNILLIVPWMGMTLYTLYYNHYLGFVTGLTILKKVRKVGLVPWANLIVNALLLIIRVTLTVRVFQLCVHIWFKKKLDEMKNKHLYEK